MCGIAGIYAYAPAGAPVDERELLAIRDRMRARGPDGAGTWMSTDRRVGLAHRRLSIIDLNERAAQPMHSADGRYVITFNGEIYNYRELRSELEAHGAVFQTTSDTEVLLQLYAERGERMLEVLRGMFAFAIWDNQTRTLLLVRDPFGIKPLYYADDGRSLRFASQVKALLAGGQVSRDLDPAGQVGFYLYGSLPWPRTMYRAVRCLPAGSVIRVVDGRVEAPRYYHSIAETWQRSLQREPSAEPVQLRVRRALVDSVRHHLVADVPIAIFLSAGIDSGALAALVAETEANDRKAVTIAFDEMAGSSDDESLLARLVADRYGFTHHLRVVTQREFEDDVPAIFDAMDQPSIDGINTWFVSKATAEAGVKVAISGLGGDELFGGYPSFRSVPQWVKSVRPFSKVPALGRATRAVIAPLLEHRSSLSPKVAGMLEYGSTYSGAYFLKRALFMPWELEQVLPRDVVHDGLRDMPPLDYLDSLIEPDPGTAFSRVSTLETCHYMRNQLLRDTDWASMAHSLEARVPLVDRVLFEELSVDLAHREPPPGKPWLAAAPRKPLPREVVERAKTGFGTPIPVWIECAPELDAWRRVATLNDPRCHWARRWAYTVGRHCYAMDHQ